VKVVTTVLALLVAMSLGAQNEMDAKRPMLTVEHIEKATGFDGEMDEDQIQLALGCDQEIYLTSNFIFPGFYSAIDLIYANGILQSGSLMLQCETEIVLDVGFEVTLGAELDAYIDVCIP